MYSKRLQELHILCLANKCCYTSLKEVSDDAYLYVVNARGLEEEFDNKLLFEPTLIHTKIKTDYLENEIQNMIDTMNSTKIPDSNKSCNNCAYARQRSKTDTL